MNETAAPRAVRYRAEAERLRNVVGTFRDRGRRRELLEMAAICERLAAQVLDSGSDSK